MTWTLWATLLFATIVISLTPGAGAVNTMTNSINEGWRRSIWGIAGQQLALIVHVVIVAAGVGVFIANSPVLFEIVRYAGAAYLVYLGLRLIFARVADEDASVESRRTRESGWSMLRRGFWVNILNPKAIVFFLAFVPQFIRLDRDPLPQYLVLIITVIVVDVLVMWFFFAVAARPFRRLTATASGQKLLNRIFGALFIAVAALLAIVH
ncbi:LysE family transporter [Microbacterium sp. NC79]|uniref:LysE family transporter n=1 Tax=Microbacterium sp. NC79 TaxID=2851009 RepID=UPI001C2BEBFA|nr:LysE family transporter [Microbacterium sp. NC79]MBV0894723.1 LysE family transporter [Microbacterium sp. NC79]